MWSKSNCSYTRSASTVITDFQWDSHRDSGLTGLPFLGMNFNLTMSSTAGMRNASVLPLPVFAAARRSLKNKMEKAHLLKTLQWLLWSSEEEPKFFRWPSRPDKVCPPLISWILSLNPLLPSFSAPAMLLFPRYPNYIPTTQPLHLLVPLEIASP